LSRRAYPARNRTNDSVLLHRPSACVSQCFRLTIITPVSAQVSIKVPAFSASLSIWSQGGCEIPTATVRGMDTIRDSLGCCSRFAANVAALSAVCLS